VDLQQYIIIICILLGNYSYVIPKISEDKIGDFLHFLNI
jgi:hypothetical protein